MGNGVYAGVAVDVDAGVDVDVDVVVVHHANMHHVIAIENGHDRHRGDRDHDHVHERGDDHVIENEKVGEDDESEVLTEEIVNDANVNDVNESVNEHENVFVVDKHLMEQ